jgi:two-component system osmolarity sensor histidine kinase EnvZ
MLEDYLAFARGDGGEEARSVHLRKMLEQIAEEARSQGMPVTFIQSSRRREMIVPIKRNAFKRALTNLIGNANRFATEIVIRASGSKKFIIINIDDNGPGIPESERENVFRPFYRLDHARNQASGNSGLGLAIARDIARSHGGDITLGDSAMGGLQVTIRLPV